MSKYAVDELTALTTDSDITIKGRGTGKVSLGDGELLFPDADGTANQVIKTDGSGALSFVSAASSDPGGSNTHVQYNSSGAFAGSSNLTFDGSKFTVAGSITAGGSAAGNVLTLTSTDAGSASGPDIELFRDSASAANNDQLGNIRFYGRDSASNKQLYAKIEGKSGSVTSGSERGILEFLTAHTDTGALTSSMSLGGNATVFNANFKDIDFRVKGTIHSHLFVVDALSNKVGISAIGGQNPAASLLHIQSPDAGTIVTIETTNTGSASGPDLELYRNSATPATSDALGKIAFYGEEATSSDKIAYASIEASIDDATNTAYEGQLNFQIASSGALASFLLLHNRAGSEPEVVVNEDSNNMDFRVESNAQTHMLFVDAGSSFVSIGSSISTKVTGATGLQIVDGDLGLMVGADVGAKTLTDATQKKGRIAMPHYDNAEEALCLIGSDANGSTSAVNIGGSVNTLNAATVVKFYTAANDTTLKGTEAMRIDNSQRVLIGHTSNLGVLSINHSLQVNGTGENDAGMSFGNGSATAHGCRLTFLKS